MTTVSGTPPDLPTPNTLPFGAIKFQPPANVPVVPGATIGTDKSTVSPGFTDLGNGTEAGALMELPLKK